jgi:hypothetical protein
VDTLAGELSVDSDDAVREVDVGPAEAERGGGQQTGGGASVFNSSVPLTAGVVSTSGQTPDGWRVTWTGGNTGTAWTVFAICD